MADVGSVSLSIAPGSSAATRLVTVSYTLTVSHDEVVHGPAFRELVTLIGDDPVLIVGTPVGSRQVALIRDDWFRPAAAGAVTRTFTREVRASSLAEDPDPPFPRGLRDPDEIVAQVKVTPFETTGGIRTSSIVSGNFG